MAVAQWRKTKISYPSRAHGFILFVVGSMFVVLNLHVLWFLFYLSSFYVMRPMMHVSLDWRYELSFKFCLRRVWRYQRGNQNPNIEEVQTTQWPREKVQKDKHEIPLIVFFFVCMCNLVISCSLYLKKIAYGIMLYSQHPIWLMKWYTPDKFKTI
jgi:hypothetical protein